MCQMVSAWSRLLIYFAIVVSFLAGCAAPSRGQATTNRSYAAQDETGQATSQPAENQFEGWSREQWEAWLKPPPPDQPQPKFVCKERTLNVGKVWKDHYAKITYELFNAGDAPLRIKVRSY